LRQHPLAFAANFVCVGIPATPDNSFSRVLFHVSLDIGTDKQIFGAIVGRIPVYVMDNLFTKKKPSKHFLCNQYVFVDVSPRIRTMVFWHFDGNIPIGPCKGRAGNLG